MTLCIPQIIKMHISHDGKKNIPVTHLLSVNIHPRVSKNTFFKFVLCSCCNPFTLDWYIIMKLNC